jgi:hypothetical protein
MSASAVRGGQVYVEIGANPSKLLNALRLVNTKVAGIGEAMASAGVRASSAGAAMAAPIAGLGMAMAAQTQEFSNAKAAVVDLSNAIGSAVAPAFVGVAKIVAEVTKSVTEFVRAHPEAVRQVAALGAVLVGVGVPLIGVGNGMVWLSKASSVAIAPIMSLVSTIASLGAALITIAASQPVLALAGIIAGAAFAAQAAGVDIGKLGGAIGSSLSGPIAKAKSLMLDLASTATVTVEGIYRAIASGDLAGAMDIAWAGAVVAWLKGQKAIMDALDPFVSLVQNALDYLKTNAVNNWDALGTDSAAAVRTLSAIVLGVFDNLANGVMATFDTMVGAVQKAWIRIQDFFKGATDTQQKLDAIDKENQSRAEERGKMRPGIQKRLEDATVVNQLNEGALIARQQRNRELSDRRMAGREDANRQRSTDRADAVAQANQNLRDQVNRFPVPAPVAQASTASTKVMGTFSAFGIGQMGAFNVEQQQLEELKRIREEIKRQGAAVVA